MYCKEKRLNANTSPSVFCLPRITVKDVEIKQSHTTDVVIPVPGYASIDKSTMGYGSIYVFNDNRLEWVYNFREDNTKESLILQPGHYKAVYKSKYANSSIYTVEKNFTIESGKSTKVELYN